MSATSLPGMIGAFQTEWDASVIETHMLRKELEQVRRLAPSAGKFRSRSQAAASSSDPRVPSRVPILWGADEDSGLQAGLGAVVHGGTPFFLSYCLQLVHAGRVLIRLFPNPPSLSRELTPPGLVAAPLRTRPARISQPPRADGWHPSWYKPCPDQSPADPSAQLHAVLTAAADC